MTASPARVACRSFNHPVVGTTSSKNRLERASLRAHLWRPKIAGRDSGTRQREEPMTIQQVPQDQWAIGDNYERYIGRWSRPVAHQFVTWLALPGALRWLDVGCGTGALTESILKDCAPASVLGIDTSTG